MYTITDFSSKRWMFSFLLSLVCCKVHEVNTPIFFFVPNLVVHLFRNKEPPESYQYGILNHFQKTGIYLGYEFHGRAIAVWMVGLNSNVETLVSIVVFGLLFFLHSWVLATGVPTGLFVFYVRFFFFFYSFPILSAFSQWRRNDGRTPTKEKEQTRSVPSRE